MDSAGDKLHPKLRVVTDAPTSTRRPSLRSEREDLDALVAAFVAGDAGALRDLVGAGQPVVLAIVRRYVRTPQDAGHLVHRTFSRAVDAARRTLRSDPERSLAFRRSLLRAALSAASAHLGREALLAPACLAELGPPDRGAARGPDALPRAGSAGGGRAAVMRLSRREREVLTLALDADLRLPDVAEVLGITLAAAKANLASACASLRGVAPGPARPAACGALAPSLSLRAMDALDRPASARVEGHLASCRACREEAKAIAEALRSAALAPPSAAELRALDDVPARVLRALRRSHARARRAAIALAAGAATLALMLALLRSAHVLSGG